MTTGISTVGEPGGDLFQDLEGLEHSGLCPIVRHSQPRRTYCCRRGDIVQSERRVLLNVMPLTMLARKSPLRRRVSSCASLTTPLPFAVPMTCRSVPPAGDRHHGLSDQRWKALQSNLQALPCRCGSGPDGTHVARDGGALHSSLSTNRHSDGRYHWGSSGTQFQLSLAGRTEPGTRSSRDGSM